MSYNSDDPKFHKEVFDEVGGIVQECVNYLSDEEFQALEVIYALGSTEGSWHSFNVFFQIQNKLFEIHQIKNKDDRESQLVILEQGTDFLVRLKKIFKSYNQKEPTQIKIKFSAKLEEVKYNFEYDLLWSNTEGTLSDDLYDEWFEEVKNSLSS